MQGEGIIHGPGQEDIVTGRGRVFHSLNLVGDIALEEIFLV